jgi:hypothetical protein
MRVVIHDRKLKITEAGLIGIGPEEFVWRSESALHEESILDEPALQILILERIIVESHHAQSSGPGERGAVDIGFNGPFVDRDAVFIFGSRKRRRVVAEDLIFRQFLEVFGGVFAEIDFGIVAHSVHELEQRV